MPNQPRAETFVDQAGGHRCRIIGGNGEIVHTSEAYTRRLDAIRGVEDLARIVLHLTTTAPDGTLTVVVDQAPKPS